MVNVELDDKFNEKKLFKFFYKSVEEIRWSSRLWRQPNTLEVGSSSLPRIIFQFEIRLDI
ncbi:unnamed protein product [Pneumocystis jirovecii]|uniref:Uncharacterized protein n=1 Tax=Pneumocystis jirovecii TaxID=42068 RepID=L0P8T7_PNEJI|nr:unnamed protein product [Pneumocystis jirovecii]